MNKVANFSVHPEFAIAELTFANEKESAFILRKTLKLSPTLIDRSKPIKFKCCEECSEIFNVISPEDTMVLKILNKTYPDIRDAQQIFTNLYDKLDLNYIEYLCKIYKMSFKTLLFLLHNELPADTLKRN